MNSPSPKQAVLLLNLGGPESLSQVKPFLIRLFDDPEILRIRFSPLRKLLAWVIATLREKKSRALYEQIGGGSPLRRLTEDQAKKVEELIKSEGKDWLVRVAFSCSSPLIEAVVKDLVRDGVTTFLALPLYPQYSFTTTKGALKRVRAAVLQYCPKAQLSEIKSWPTHPLFLKAHGELIQSEVKKFSIPNDQDTHLLFSAHSIPEKLVTELGDPYKSEMEKSVMGVVEASGWKGPWSLAWQSKLGPIKWLGPSTSDALKELGQKKTQQVLVVPIAFVTDHIETLHEIDVLFQEEAKAAGIKEFRRTPGLNSHPTFIKALASLITSPTEIPDK